MKRVSAPPRGRRSSRSLCSTTSWCLSMAILLILVTYVGLNTRILQNFHLSEQESLVSLPGTVVLGLHPNNPVADALSTTMRSSASSIRVSPPTTAGHPDNETQTFTEASHDQSSTMLLPESPDATIWNNLNLIWTLKNQTVLSNLTETDINLRRIHPVYGQCSWTAQYRLKLHPSDNETDDYWALQSLDKHGNPKTAGGDELYIMYHHRNRTKASPTAVAYARDQDDGTYRLEFHSTPFTMLRNIDRLNIMNRKGSALLRQGRFQPSGLNENGTHFQIDGGILSIFMIYTCGLGTLHHPAKKHWRTGGATMTKYNAYVPYPPQIQVFEPPNSDKAVDLARYHKVMIFGDSNLHALSRDHAKEITNLHFIRKPDSALQFRSVKRLFLPKIQWFVNQTMHEDADPSKHRYALMLGSHCWDIVFPQNSGPAFQNHLKSVRYLLIQLKYTFGPLGNVDFYWHSGVALHLYVAGLEDGWFDRTPLKYMSYYRSFELYRKQVQALKQVGNVTLLDFMHTTYLSGHQYISGDARHAMPKLNRQLLAYYYPNTVFEN